MNPAFSARLHQAIAQPAMGFNAAAEQPNANEKNKTTAAERRDLFHNSINEALEGRSSDDHDVTDLLREVDRLMRHWPDDASGLLLADDLNPGVRNALTTAIEQAGHTVIHHWTPSDSVEVHATEMKKPPAEDEDDVAGSRDEDPTGHFFCSLLFAVNTGEAAEVTAAMLGLKTAGITPEQFVRTVREHGSLLEAIKCESASAVTAFMNGLNGLGLGQKDIADIVTDDDGLGMAMHIGDAALVTAFMDGLKVTGLSSRQIEDIAYSKSGLHDMGIRGSACLHGALYCKHAAAVTAFMRGLQGAGLSPDQVYRLVAVDGRMDEPTAAGKAYRDGLRWLGEQQLITREQLSGLGVGPAEEAAGPVDKDTEQHVLQLMDAMNNGDADRVTSRMRDLKNAGLAPDELARALHKSAAAKWTMYNGHAAAITAFMKGVPELGLSQKHIADLARRLGKRLGIAMAKGHAAAVTAFMEGLKAIGLSTHQFEDILCTDRIRGQSLMYGIFEPYGAPVTAYMAGLHGAGLSPDQVYRIVKVDKGISVERTAGWKAYRKGLRLLAQQRLITPEQQSELERAADCIERLNHH